MSSPRVSNTARPVVDALLTRASATKLKPLLEAAARADGNKVLSGAEAQLLTDVFTAIAPGGGPLTTELLGQAKLQLDAKAKAAREAADLDGLSTDFTLQGTSVKSKMITELRDAVAHAKGRPVELNVMIFEFQSDEVEQALFELARDNPNLTLRVLADSGQATDSGGNALPSLLKKKLPNVQVKYKKDFPYVFDTKLGRPRYNHGSSQGLLHHKGYSVVIDGKPHSMSSGSFNWSDTADTKNYENLVTMRNMDSASRRGIEQFNDEFAGFWNSDAALSPNNFANFKSQKWNEMLAANGKPGTNAKKKTDDDSGPYVPRLNRSVDLNAVSTRDTARLAELAGPSLAKTIAAERKAFGRFTSIEDLVERVPLAGTLPADVREQLFFGSGLVSINTATEQELDEIGLSKQAAAAIVKHREANGDFESLDEIRALGVPASTFTKVKNLLSSVDVEGFFNSRPFGAAQGGTGYGSGGTRTTAAMGANGQVSQVAANVTVAATDLFNRAKPGETVSVAMYGMSVGSPEYESMVAAAKRGVNVKVVLDDGSTKATVAALKALATQGHPIDVRVQKAKTMHEKFVVKGNDVVWGSANFSSSSSTKHSENRFAAKNEEGLANAFQARFDDLWNKSKIV